RGLGELKAQTVLLREETQLLSLHGIGRFHLDAPVTAERRAEYDPVRGLGELDRAVRERDADAIVHEREILHAGRLGGGKGRLPQRFPDLVGGAATWPNTRGASAAIPSRRRRTRTRFTFMEQTPRGTENSL